MMVVCSLSEVSNSSHCIADVNSLPLPTATRLTRGSPGTAFTFRRVATYFSLDTERGGQPTLFHRRRQTKWDAGEAREAACAALETTPNGQLDGSASLPSPLPFGCRLGWICSSLRPPLRPLRLPSAWQRRPWEVEHTPAPPAQPFTQPAAMQVRSSLERGASDHRTTDANRQSSAPPTTLRTILLPSWRLLCPPFHRSCLLDLTRQPRASRS